MYKIMILDGRSKKCYFGNVMVRRCDFKIIIEISNMIVSKRKYLVVNLGSTSLKCVLLEMPSEKIIANIKIEQIKTQNSYLTIKWDGKAKQRYQYSNLNYENGMDLVLQILKREKFIASYNEIDNVIYRIVQGGEKYYEPAIIDDEVKKDIMAYKDLLPIHHKNVIKVINVTERMIDQNKNIAVFDSAFFQTLSMEHFLYPIPYDLYEKYKIRKYGFHGNSYRYVLERASKLWNQDINTMNLVICHLGGGSSLCAIRNGKAYDTSMGYTPLDGMMMSTRSGSIDASIVCEIAVRCGLSYDEVLELLNYNSGYFGICGESDIKTVCNLAEAGNERAHLAIEMANISFKKQLGSMLSLVPNNQALVITGGMGSRNYRQREKLLSNLEHFGIFLDMKANKGIFDSEGIISYENSGIPIWVIPSHEELQMAREVEKTMRLRYEKS